MVAQAVPVAPAAQGKAHAATVSRGVLVGAPTRAAAATFVLGGVLAVIAQAKEPHEPEHEQPQVEDSKADHEDPPLQAHWDDATPGRKSLRP